jgi:hypothetical protein
METTLIVKRLVNELRRVRMVMMVMMAVMVAGCNMKPGVTIMSGGKSDYVIYVADTANHQIMRAANLLQTYLKKIGGAELPIKFGLPEVPLKAFLINPDARTGHEDAFSIVTMEKQIFITGGTHKGCIYGVVDLLEKQLGCRMYAPGFEVIPKLDKIRLPKLDVKDKPVNEYRNVYGQFGLNEDYRDWQRIDVIQDVFADGYYVHTMGSLVPWQENFKSHPEYYAMMNGKRVIDQLCLSNPEVLKIALAKLEHDIPLQPGKQVWSVSQNDNFSYCQCDDCKKIIAEEGSPAGPVIRFVNEVAKKFPDKIISTLAYQYSRQAPVVTKPAANVQIMLCTIELNRSQPIAEDPRSASFLKDIVDWGKIAKHIYLWDYTVNFSHHTTPFPNMHVLQPNIQLFVKNNVFSHFQQSNTDVGHEFSELKSYLLSRLLWNPDIKVDSIITDFTNGYYGAAGLFVRMYRDTLEGEILKTKEWLDIYGPPTAHESTFLSEANIARYLGYFDQAIAAVKDQPEILLHVKTALLPVQYAAMEIGKNHMFAPRGWYSMDGKNFVIRENMVKMLEDFNQTCKDAKVKTLSEGGLTPENYYQSTKRFLKVEVQDNMAFQKTVTANPLPSPKYGGGDLTYLTNGVKGANDWKVHWQGWEGQDFQLDADLGAVQKPLSIEMSTLYDPKSWILHPASVSCSVSEDGKTFKTIGAITVTGDQQKEDVTRTFAFKPGSELVRYIKFNVKGTIQLPKWHPSAGGASWVFVDEIVVK